MCQGRSQDERNPTDIPEDIDGDQIGDEEDDEEAAAAADSDEELYEWVMSMRGRLNEAGPFGSDDADMDSDPDYEVEMESAAEDDEDELLGEEEDEEDEADREAQAAIFAQWKKDFLAARRLARQSGGAPQESHRERDADDGNGDGAGAAPAK